MSYPLSCKEYRCLILVNKNKIKIGEIIKAQRKRLGLTQFELAEKADMHEKQISRIEAGLNHPTFDNFIKIIDILELKLGDFDTKMSEKPNKLKDDLIFIINSSTDKELKTYFDVINSLKKNL